jgi:ABC-2 type transport system ATP-binding protein
LADVERLCRRIVLIDQGTLIFDGAVDTLRDQYGTHRTLVVELSEPEDHVEMDGTEAELTTKTLARFRFDRRTMSAETLIRRVAERYRVRDISIEEPELESIIRRIYREGYVAEPHGEATAT